MNNKSESGQSLVEFAFSIFVLIILLVGIVDLGRAFFSYMALRDAAQEGALFGATYPADVSGVEARVRATSQFPVDLTDTSAVHVYVNVGVPPCAGSPIIVTVTYDFPITTPFLGIFVGSQVFTIEATVTDTILRPPCY